MCRRFVARDPRSRNPKTFRQTASQALNDLESIEEYYEDTAPDYASLLVQEILEQAEQLETFPRMGRVVPEIGDEAIRELIYRDYRIIDIVDADDTEVAVLTVVHSSQHLGSLNSDNS